MADHASGFGKVPRHLLRNPNIPAAAKALFALMACETDFSTGQCLKPNEWLADHLDCRVRTINDYRNILRAYGYLIGAKRGHAVCMYVADTPPQLPTDAKSQALRQASDARLSRGLKRRKTALSAAVVDDPLRRKSTLSDVEDDGSMRRKTALSDAQDDGSMRRKTALSDAQDDGSMCRKPALSDATADNSKRRKTAFESVENRRTYKTSDRNSTESLYSADAPTHSGRSARDSDRKAADCDSRDQTPAPKTDAARPDCTQPPPTEKRFVDSDSKMLMPISERDVTARCEPLPDHNAIALHLGRGNLSRGYEIMVGKPDSEIEAIGQGLRAADERKVVS